MTDELKDGDPRTAPKMLAALRSGEMDEAMARRCVASLGQSIVDAEAGGDFDTSTRLREALGQIVEVYPVNIPLPKARRRDEASNDDGTPNTVPIQQFNEVNDRLSAASVQVDAAKIELDRLGEANQRLRLELAQLRAGKIDPAEGDASAAGPGQPVKRGAGRPTKKAEPVEANE